MTPVFKPMLAYTITDTSKLQYPQYCSIKLDGIRVVILDGVVYSRSMKPIRSTTVQKLFGKPELNGLDAEVLYGPWNAADVFNATTRAVMSTNLPEGFLAASLSLAVFDCTSSSGPYLARLEAARMIVDAASCLQVRFVPQEEVRAEEELIQFEDKALSDGYEGVMCRGTEDYQRYKQGRSTEKEGNIGKLKRFSDDEAVVIGFEEKMTNTNPKFTNGVGRSQRSQDQEGMVGAGTLGALVCECNGIKFTMGSGFDDVGRDEVWNNQDKYLGKLAKFKYFTVGMKDSYRFPIFLGWRDADDISK